MRSLKMIVLLVLISGLMQLLPAQDDAGWDDVFTLGGFNGYVQAVVSAPNGDVYVGGDFNLNNGILVNHIVRWDGESWHTLGTGTLGGWYNGRVNAISVDSNRIYVGGGFSTAGNVGASNIAMWDGSQWHALGSGVNGSVDAIAVDNGNVYVGGNDITEAGGVAVKNVAMWDGENWHAMGAGLTRWDYVNAMVAHNDTVYAGGNFILSGTDTVNYVAMWDGSQWNDIDGGVDNTVYGLDYDDGKLYVGGSFSNAGETSAFCLAIWDGAQWSAIENGPNTSVRAIDVYNGEIHIAGQFTEVDSMTANRIAKWDGEKWHTFGEGFSFTVNAIAVNQDMVYAGGDFDRSGDTDVDYFAGWDGQAWATPGRMSDQSVDYEVKAMAVDGDKMYVGGTFIKAGGDTVNRIAMWDGNTWHSMGAGFDNTVNTIVVDNGKVYAGGAFAFTGDLLVSRIAMWDGQQWHALGDGMNNQVYAIAIDDTNVYVGGNFTSAGEIWARRIARWDGEKWHALGGDGGLDGAGGLDGYPGSHVTSLHMDQDTLYIGGLFARAFYQGGDFVRAKSVAKWHDNTWYGLADFSIYNQQVIKSIYVEDSRIYVAGSFPTATYPYNEHKVVMWDDSKWNDMGVAFTNSSNPTSSIYTLNTVLKQNGSIYTAGSCNLAGTDTVNFIARLEGDKWVPLGSGLNDFVYAMAADSNFIYAGGRFTMAGNNASHRIARYNVSGISEVESITQSPVADYSLMQNYPNPFNPVTNIKFRLPKTSEVAIDVFNMLGQQVTTLISRQMPAGTHIIEFDASNMASGVYFYRIIAGPFHQVRKMIMVK